MNKHGAFIEKSLSCCQGYNDKLLSIEHFMKFFLNKRYHCPVCDKSFDNYNPLPELYAEKTKIHGFKFFGTGEVTVHATYSCPNCGATDRERLFAHYLKKNISRKESFVFYHFAPERRLRKLIQGYFHNCNYKTFDLLSNEVDSQADLTDLKMINDNECDFFICSHVLEHIENDRKAIAELFRITKSGGKGILMVPISLAIQKSIENIPNVETDEDRWRHYGQNDHVRLYAKCDFVERVRESGFDLIQLGIDHYGTKLFKKLGVKMSSTLYIVQKKEL